MISCLLLLIPLLVSQVCLAQEITDTTMVDTNSIGYKIGYNIASWLPFLIIIALAFAVIRKQYRQR